jgi:DNA-directed RNA polymerase beta' subunit
LGNLLGMKTTELEKVIYFQDYVVIDPGDTPLKKMQLLTEEEFRAAREKYGASLPKPAWAPRRFACCSPPSIWLPSVIELREELSKRAASRR